MEISFDERLQLLGLNKRVEDMQGRVFYCEDDEGVLRRWAPPRPVSIKEAD